MNSLLDELAETTGATKSDVLRRAIVLFEAAVRAKGKGRQMAIVDQNEKVVTTIVGL